MSVLSPQRILSVGRKELLHILRDPMTRVNMDVMHEVCYRGFFHLEQAVKEGKPAGLKILGNWGTFYEGLSSLSPTARDSACRSC